MIFLQSASVFSEVGGRLTERIFSGILWFGIAFLIIAVLGGLMWYFLIYKRKFDIFIKITSERADDKNKILFDNAAILMDKKSNSKYLRFWSLNIELPLPNYNLIQNSSKGDFIELYRDAENRFYYMKTKVNKTYLVRANGKVIPMALQRARLIDSDMEFWSTKRKKQNKSMFDVESPWMKILPYLPHILAGAITIFVLYILMSYLPEVMQQLTELVQQLNRQTAAEIVSSG